MIRFPYGLAATSFALALGFANRATAQNMIATRVATDSIVVDGRADDPGWSNVQSRDDFTQREPYEGRPSSPTQVSIAYDDDALYVLVRAYDSHPEQIVGRRTRRDESSTADWIHLWLATNSHDDRYAYRFSVNAANVKQDARLIDGSAEDVSFNAVWHAEVARNPQGWAVEYRIPFHQLAYTASPAFRCQVIRYQARTGEQSTLFPYPRSATLPVRYMQPLLGLAGLPNPVHLEMLPYTSLVLNGSPTKHMPVVRAGADFKLALSPEVNLQATILPDFGQVEADPSELNLSVFETYFAEQRPFFLDGQETLDFGLRQGVTTDKLFYTRRIGQPPRVDAASDPDDVLSFPKQTTIIAATKLLARSSRGYTVSMLQAITSEASARIRDGRETRAVQVAPLSQYFVARGTQSFNGGRTNIGAAATTVSRELGDALLYEQLPKNATTAGIDLEHRQGEYRITSKVFTSRIEGSPAAILRLQENSVHYYQRPDARHVRLDPTRTALNGYGMTFVGAKHSGAPWRASLGATLISPGFEPNDLGFLQRADDINAFAYLQYLVNEPTQHFRSYWFEASGGSNYTFGGEPTTNYAAIAANWITRDTATARVQFQRDTERFDPRVLRGGSSMRVPGRFSGSIVATTNDRKDVALDVSTWGGKHDGHESSYWIGGAFNLRLRPASFIQLSLGPNYQHSLDGWAYVDEASNGNAILAHMPRDTFSFTFRGSVAVTSNLTFQLYSMPYFSAGQYYDFVEVVAPKSAKLKDHYVRTPYRGDRYYWFTQARTNAVLRWEYVPGSSVFLVWSREQASGLDSVGNLRLSRDVSRLISSPSVDTLMLKWAHWISN